MADLFEEKNISPMLLNEVKEPFDDDNYIYELKLDGIRCVAYIEPKSVTLSIQVGAYRRFPLRA